MNDRELLALAPLVAMVFIIGFFPRVFLVPMRGAVERVQHDVITRITKNPAPKYYFGNPSLLPRAAEAPPKLTTGTATAGGGEAVAPPAGAQAAAAQPRRRSGHAAHPAPAGH
ncbi:MAG: hypothetical protein U0169_20010 [Polyangiaceae bacterium]